jgi:hypothetical protein
MKPLQRMLVLLPLVLLALLAAVAAFGQSPATPQATAPRLLALAQDKQAEREILGTVNVTTGLITPLGSGLANCCTTAVLDAALDSAGGRYFAVMSQENESSPRLATFSSSMGAATISAPLSTTLAINYLAYDTASGQLLALASETQPPSMQLLRIDPATAGVTRLGSPLPECCSPKAQDAAYDNVQRRLYAILQPYAGEPQLRLVALSGVDGTILANLPITSTLDVTRLEIDHLAFNPTDNLLWALINDVDGSAQRLARIDPASGFVTPIGPGIASCCDRMTTDIALDTANQVLVAPMIDRTDPQAAPVPTFFRFSLATGAVLDSIPVDPDYDLHYVTFEPQGGTPLTPVPTTTAAATTTPRPTPGQTPSPTPAVELYLPAIQREQGS